MAQSRVRLPSFIYLYNGGKTESLNIEEIVNYLKKRLTNTKVEIREDFISFVLTRLPDREKREVLEKIAQELASSKVHDIKNKDITHHRPLPAEINYEKRRLADSQHKTTGILYDGFRLLDIFTKLIPKHESNLKYCHIIFTNQLFGTYSENDLRYHARVVVFGFPSIISTTGIVEAPAKPREFYLKRQLGLELFTLKEEFKGRFIDYNDPQLTEVMKGYCMQTIFFHMISDPFCNDKNCRLYNAHWQEEVIHAQLKSENEFCNLHKEILTKALIS
jgi:hypothetical protein